jgi:hypothetical protein
VEGGGGEHELIVILCREGCVTRVGTLEENTSFATIPLVGGVGIAREEGGEGERGEHGERGEEGDGKHLCVEPSVGKRAIRLHISVDTSPSCLTASW